MAMSGIVGRIYANTRRLAEGRVRHLVVAAASASFIASYVGAYLLRFEFEMEPRYATLLSRTVVFVVLAKLVVFHLAGVFRILWAYTGLKDLFRIVRATVLATAMLATANLLLLPSVELLVPRSVLIFDGILTLLSMSGLFVILRWAREQQTQRGRRRLPLEPVLVVGAGDAGEGLLRELQRNPAMAFRVVGFLDDDAHKRGRVLRGVPILGVVDDAAELALRQGVRTALIAIPSATGPQLRRIVARLVDAGLAVKTLPRVGRFVATGSPFPQLREVAIEDLLRRDSIRLDDAAISKFLTSKRVLVTGAAGSIGSELCRQILGYGPARLIALDWAETPLHDLELELRARSRDAAIAFELGDVTDPLRVESLLAAHRPEAVFHAAALKHVPLLEAHPREAVRVNLGGTRLVAEAARTVGAETFVMISTDKAVNPTSVMGMTKRVAERLVQSLNKKDGQTRFVSVRFGNVLDSRGSVVPIFKRQIAAGGPLTVTHPEMRRYFMTIPEAVQLVLQSAVLGTGGDVFLLDMGEPIKIVDLAEDLIRLSGLTPGVDVKIEFSGIRPGEKLFEELRLPSELAVRTAHPQILCVQSRGPEAAELERIARLIDSAAYDATSPSLLNELRAAADDDGTTRTPAAVTRTV